MRNFIVHLKAFQCTSLNAFDQGKPSSKFKIGRVVLEKTLSKRKDYLYAEERTDDRKQEIIKAEISDHVIMKQQ